MSFYLNAEIVKNIKIEGNSRISDETIKVYGDLKELNTDYSKKDLDSILKNLYSTDFFENVNLEIKNNVLFIKVTEYPSVNQLIVIGEKSNKFKKEIKKIISTKDKGSYNENKLNIDINKINDFYSNLGYNFSKVTRTTKI